MEDEEVVIVDRKKKTEDLCKNEDGGDFGRIFYNKKKRIIKESSCV